jgi:hypothetical protein
MNGSDKLSEREERLPFQRCKHGQVRIPDVMWTCFWGESDFGSVDLGLAKMTRYRVICHTIGVKSRYEIVVDHMNPWPFAMEIADD